MTNRTFKAGLSREQTCLLPPRVEDYVGPDNPVRAIESYVGALDLVRFEFRHADHGVGVGQPPYDPADLLKLYLYGYLNQVRSSRRLEREAHRNLELIWLLKGLTPGYRTIAKFRQENWAALKAANRDFVLLARELDLLGGDAGGDRRCVLPRRCEQGEHRDAQAAGGADSRRWIAISRPMVPLWRPTTRQRRRTSGNAKEPPGAGIAEKLTALLEKRARAKADLAKLEDNGETQLSRTDGDARLLTKNGQSVAGYNVQIAVDDRHKLIVASEVVNDGNDNGQLHAIALGGKTGAGRRDAAGVGGCGLLQWRRR